MPPPGLVHMARAWTPSLQEHQVAGLDCPVEDPLRLQVGRGDDRGVAAGDEGEPVGQVDEAGQGQAGRGERTCDPDRVDSREVFKRVAP